MGERIRCQTHFGLTRQRFWSCLNPFSLCLIFGLLFEFVCKCEHSSALWVCVGSGRVPLSVQRQVPADMHLLLSDFTTLVWRVLGAGSADSQLLRPRNMQKGTLLMYWPLGNYLDLLLCDLLVKERLSSKANQWIRQKKKRAVQFLSFVRARAQL